MTGLYRRQGESRESTAGEDYIQGNNQLNTLTIILVCGLFHRARRKEREISIQQTLFSDFRAFSQSSSSASIPSCPCHHEQREPQPAGQAKGLEHRPCQGGGPEGSSAFAPSPLASSALPRHTSPLLPNPPLQNTAVAAMASQLGRPPGL